MSSVSFVATSGDSVLRVQVIAHLQEERLARAVDVEALPELDFDVQAQLSFARRLAAEAAASAVRPAGFCRPPDNPPPPTPFSHLHCSTGPHSDRGSLCWSLIGSDTLRIPQPVCVANGAQPD